MKTLIRFFAICLIVTGCDEDVVEPEEIINSSNPSILSFTVKEQTLATTINATLKTIEIEVKNGTDLTNIVPEFELSEGSVALISNKVQNSGESIIDFSTNVTLNVKNSSGQSEGWNVNISPLECKILIDASHGGGTWWYPQYDATGFDQDKPHQGKAFADHLRSKGFIVDELPRGTQLTEKLFYGYYIVIRTSGFSIYTEDELDVYKNVMSRGMNLAFFTDHKKNDRTDEFADFLGLKFEGVAIGKISKFSDHKITKNMTPFDYVAGSVLTNEVDIDAKILGWLGESDFVDLNFNNIKDSNEPTAMPVMGILNHPTSNIFFIGDMNAFQIRPQPFVDNLIDWMGVCDY